MNDELVRLIVKKIIEQLYNDSTAGKRLDIKELSEAKPSFFSDEVIIGLGGSFSNDIFETISGVSHYCLLKELASGIEEEGIKPRFIRVLDTADAALIALSAAKLSGSGIGIGIQSKGTAAIHQISPFPSVNLELLSQATLITSDIYRKIGKNAAKYAKGMLPEPVSVINDCAVRPKQQAKAALYDGKTEYFRKDAAPIELTIEF